MSAPQLTVVIPVYNEEGAIETVLLSWLKTLGYLKVPFLIAVYNDGSKDGTPHVLDRLAKQDARLKVVHKTNSGHGPTILQGYREAEGEWVFHVDSDDEMKAANFPELWQKKDAYDFIIGYRVDRESPWSRRIVSLVSRLTVLLFYGSGIRDVNSPYRLMRRAKFASIFSSIPKDTFAPNVILSGCAVKQKMRILECPVPYEPRRTGEVSIKKWKLFKAAVRSFRQTVSFSFGQSNG